MEPEKAVGVIKSLGLLQMTRSDPVHLQSISGSQDYSHMLSERPTIPMYKYLLNYRMIQNSKQNKIGASSLLAVLCMCMYYVDRKLE